jgi:hypothetical protein
MSLKGHGPEPRHRQKARTHERRKRKGVEDVSSEQASRIMRVQHGPRITKFVHILPGGIWCINIISQTAKQTKIQDTT